jgi:hypothetical protein
MSESEDDPTNPTKGFPDEPFQRGLDAYNAGRDVSANPYPEGDPKNAEWTTGWYTAEARNKD